MSERLLIGTRKGLFQVVRSQGGWSIERSDFLGVPVPLAIRDHRDGRYHATLDHGHFGIKMHRSEDGVTWEELPAPVYPSKPEAVDNKDPIRSREVEWSLKKVWALAVGGADQPGRLWAGTVPGGLFRSDDSGSTWELVRSLWDEPRRSKWFGGGMDLPGIHSICVDPRNSEKVTVAVSCGGVWVTEDDGASWQCRAEGMRAAYMPPEQAFDQDIQDPHCVVQCATKPEVFWAQHHNGIFRSVDDCQSWQEIEKAGPATFGFAVAVDPKDGDCAWFVPAIKDEVRIPVDGAVVVTRTTDGGESFDVLREGLPQEHAYDLVYRHALDVDAKGQALAMGSTTGAVWISEDRGDTWSLLTAHLPPVYSVRFA